ncbi:MAG: dTMP kinase [Thermoprotei archaeon]
MSRKGLFIVFEGIDGAGNTTQSNLLVQWLEMQGFRVLLTKEPTIGEIGVLIKKKLKSPTVSHPAVDALLFAADRVEHVYSKIMPALNNGIFVVSDRYKESSMAYQSAQGLSQKWIHVLNKYAIEPDLTIILDVEPEISLARKPTLTDRYEKKDFLEKVRKKLLERAIEKGYPVVYTGDSVEKSHEKIVNLVKLLLEQRGYVLK